jgi:hypothetical protein
LRPPRTIGRDAVRAFELVNGSNVRFRSFTCSHRPALDETPDAERTENGQRTDANCDEKFSWHVMTPNI